MINRNIFRQYDVRGRAETELDDNTVKAIVQAFAKYVFETGRSTMLVGRDNRFSSPHIRDLTVQSLLDSGLDVIDLGQVVSPMFYFAARYLNIDAGIMITASHNPGMDNGFKLLLGSSTIYGSQIQELADMAERGERISTSRAGQLKSVDISRPYFDAITSRIKLGGRKLHIVVDCGNGTAGPIAPELFRQLGCEVTELYCESDPSFPNHHPDPVKLQNSMDMIKLVREIGADVGLGFDGDGDRLGVVAPDGAMIYGDMLMILFWREILPKYPGADCIVEVKCSQALIDEIRRLGGNPVIYKTGHSLIKAKMKEINAVFTGEMSGHMFFADEYYGFDDALYAGARVLRILSNSDKSLNDLLADVPRYYSTPEIRVKSTDKQKFSLVEKALRHFRSQYDIIDIDGVRVLFPGGWGLVRASNTGPELIVRCEGKTAEILQDIKQRVFSFLEAEGLSVPEE